MSQFQLRWQPSPEACFKPRKTISICQRWQQIAASPSAPRISAGMFVTRMCQPARSSVRLSAVRPFALPLELPWAGGFFAFAGKSFPCQIPSAVNTIFEKIRDGEIPADVIHRDEHCFAFRDISPQAPVHVLVVPNKLIPRVGAATSEDQAVLGHLLLTAAKIAAELDLAESGYRVVINNGPHGGETVPHLHVHLLGGRPLTWPPG